MKSFETIKDMVIDTMKAVVQMLVEMAQMPSMPIVSFVLTLIVDSLLYNTPAAMLSVIICSMLAVLAVVALICNYSTYAGAMKCACLMMAAFMMLSTTSDIGRMMRDKDIPKPTPAIVTPVPSGLTDDDSIGQNPSPGMKCFFCKSGKVGVCKTCDGDGRYEVLEDSIWGSRCGACGGSGICNACKGDGVMGN